MKQNHLYSIDTLRGLGSIIICLYHAPFVFGNATFANHGYMVVDFFFVLSGFVMTHSYEGRILKGESFKDFAIARFVRLYPIYFFALILGAAWLFYNISSRGLFHKIQDDFIAAFLLNLLVIPDFSTKSLVGGGPAFPFNFPAWAVFWEFVVAFAFYFWIKWKNRFEFYLWAIFAIALIIYANGKTKNDFGWAYGSFLGGGLRGFLGLIGGYIAAKYLKDIPQKLPKGVNLILFTIAWIIMGLVAYHSFFHSKDNLYLELLLAMFGYPFLVAIICNSNNIILNNWVMNYLAKISYSIYSVHALLLGIIVYLIRKNYIEASPILCFIWLVAVIIFAILAHKIIEIPAKNYLVALLRPKNNNKL